MAGDEEHQPDGPGCGGDPAATRPTITAGYTVRWTDSSDPNPGERTKSVSHKVFIEPACPGGAGLDRAGFSITLTESFVPEVADRFFVRWRDDDHDETETFVNRADAMAAYERRLRDSGACAGGPDQNGARPGTSPTSRP
jgi:hypothetical protein